MALAVGCYEGTKAFPASETYGLTSQIRRSAASIAANIAEGHGRESTATFVHFLRIAQGSLKELETHLILAQRVGLMPDDAAESLCDDCDEIVDPQIAGPAMMARTPTRYALFAIRCSLLTIHSAKPQAEHSHV